MASLRAILDTNVYEILYLKELSNVLALVKKKQLIVYGCKVIRDELRDIPKSLKVDGKSYRNRLLSIYDNLTKNHSYPAEELVEFIAKEYLKEYKGSVAKRKIFPDFKIVAVSSIHNLDVVVSEDDRTLKSVPAKNAYKTVNERNGLRTPELISLEKLIS
jgi:hypothetical protein